MRAAVMMTASLLVALTVFFAPGGGAAQVAAGPQVWGVGTISWLCYQPPCGWRGIFPVDSEGTRGRPLSIHDQPAPPLMRGNGRDLARIHASYAHHGCLLIEGKFDGQWLVVQRVLGPC